MKRAVFVTLALGVVVGLFALAQGVVAEDRAPQAITVAKILEVELAIAEADPPMLVVRAVGEVPSGGYRNPTLTRAVYVMPPQDGIQDYFLTADPPQGPAIMMISRVTASETWANYEQEAPWLKGVRIHGAGEGAMIKMLD